MGKKEYVRLLVPIAVLAFFVWNFDVAFGFLKKVWTVTEPVFAGVLLALVLSVPQDFFEGKVFRKIKKKKLRRGLALTCTFLLAGGVLVAMGFLVVPQCVQSVRDICGMLSGENAWNRLADDNAFLPSLSNTARRRILFYARSLPSISRKSFFT